jgi:CheY-like chemotaxis protein
LHFLPSFYYSIVQNISLLERIRRFECGLEMAALNTFCTATSVAVELNRSARVELGPDAGSPALPRGVLVVDDDASIRLLLDAALRQRGFTVWTACDGEEALELYRLHRSAIALVLLDVRMPILDGPQTVAVLRQWEPALTFCFMSGQSGDYSPQQLLALGAACVFEKPFRIAEVQEIVEQLSERAALSLAPSPPPQ